MKAIAYHITPQQKQWLVLANHKKHDITIIVNPLSIETLPYIAGKEVLLLLNDEMLDEALIRGLHLLGIRYIATAFAATGRIDLMAAHKTRIKVAYLLNTAVDESTNCRELIENLDQWAAE